MNPNASLYNWQGWEAWKCRLYFLQILQNKKTATELRKMNLTHPPLGCYSPCSLQSKTISFCEAGPLFFSIERTIWKWKILLSPCKINSPLLQTCHRGNTHTLKRSSLQFLIKKILTACILICWRYIYVGASGLRAAHPLVHTKNRNELLFPLTTGKHTGNPGLKNTLGGVPQQQLHPCNSKCVAYVWVQMVPPLGKNPLPLQEHAGYVVYTFSKERKTCFIRVM